MMQEFKFLLDNDTSCKDLRYAAGTSNEKAACPMDLFTVQRPTTDVDQDSRALEPSKHDSDCDRTAEASASEPGDDETERTATEHVQEQADQEPAIATFSQTMSTRDDWKPRSTFARHGFPVVGYLQISRGKIL